MVDSYRYRSSLDGLGLHAEAAAATEAPGVWLAKRTRRLQLNLRGEPIDQGFVEAAATAIGAPLPTEPNRVNATDQASVLWLGPDEWLVVAASARREEFSNSLYALAASCHCAVTDVSDARTIIRVHGPRARDVLAKGCSLDLHPRVFGLGQCAQSSLAFCQVVVHRIDSRPALERPSGHHDAGASLFDLYVGRSFAVYLWAWLNDAALEFGAGIEPPG